MGPSGAGKDTVANILSIALNIPLLCSFTTRPMRDGEVNGKEHFFVKECKTSKEKCLPTLNMVATSIGRNSPK